MLCPCFREANLEWELHNCGMILGTNAMVDLGFQVIHSNGTYHSPPKGYGVSVTPKQSFSASSSVEAEDNSTTYPTPKTLMCEEHEGNNLKQASPPVLMVSLAHAVSIRPQWTAVANIKIQTPLDNLQSSTGIVVPEEDSLASINCDFTEGIWMGQTDFKVLVTNWGSLPMTLQKGHIIIHVEEVTIVTENDDVWKSLSDSTIKTIKLEDLESHKKELCLQLNFGNHCTKEQYRNLQQFLCKYLHSQIMSWVK